MLIRKLLDPHKKKRKRQIMLKGGLLEQKEEERGRKLRIRKRERKRKRKKANKKFSQI